HGGPSRKGGRSFRPVVSYNVLDGHNETRTRKGKLQAFPEISISSLLRREKDKYRRNGITGFQAFCRGNA
ncbi:MAG TPA: hypothetical protein H9836_03820, partial [Candidatus Nocardiopsis merdipullorum]|nr:hypothetical protein [Candidatus Nocardiopsis merdipullorum]